MKCCRADSRSVICGKGVGGGDYWWREMGKKRRGEGIECVCVEGAGGWVQSDGMITELK